MKKILLFLISIFVVFSSFFTVSANCDYEINWKIWDSFKNCYSWSKLAWTDTSDLKVDGKWFQEKLKEWRNVLAVILWIWAVFWLVFSAFTFATSAWEEDKITKAKNIAKWTIIWFLSIIFSAVIITFVVNLFYSI